MNRLRDEDIAKTVSTCTKFADVMLYAKVIALDKIRDNDHNLSVPRYVNVFEEEEHVDVSKVWSELRELDAERSEADEKLASYLRELGYE